MNYSIAHLLVAIYWSNGLYDIAGQYQATLYVDSVSVNMIKFYDKDLKLCHWSWHVLWVLPTLYIPSTASIIQALLQALGTRLCNSVPAPHYANCLSLSGGDHDTHHDMLFFSSCWIDFSRFICPPLFSQCWICTHCSDIYICTHVVIWVLSPDFLFINSFIHI